MKILLVSFGDQFPAYPDVPIARQRPKRNFQNFVLAAASSDAESRSTKALAWHGKSDIRCETVPAPKIEDGRDAIIKVTACAICGSTGICSTPHDEGSSAGRRLSN